MFLIRKVPHYQTRVKDKFKNSSLHFWVQIADLAMEVDGGSSLAGAREAQSIRMQSGRSMGDSF